MGDLQKAIYLKLVEKLKEKGKNVESIYSKNVIYKVSKIYEREILENLNDEAMEWSVDEKNTKR